MKTEEKNIGSEAKTMYKDLPSSGVRYSTNTTPGLDYAKLIADIFYHIMEKLKMNGYLPCNQPAMAFAGPGLYSKGAKGETYSKKGKSGGK